MLRKIKILATVIYQEFWEWNNNLSQLKSELLQYGNYLENDSFVYTVTDGILISEEATISITINDVNDAPVVEVISAQEINDIRKQNPEIEVLSHPECPPEVIAASDYTGSTSDMSKYVKKNQPNKVMLVTECSMSDNVQVDNPNVQFIKPCNLCPHMKTITLPKVLDCLENEKNEILIPEIISRKARKAVERMVAIGRSH